MSHIVSRRDVLKAVTVAPFAAIGAKTAHGQQPAAVRSPLAVGVTSRHLQWTPLEDAIALVESLPISDEDKRRIFEGNARELFKLDIPAAA